MGRVWILAGKRHSACLMFLFTDLVWFCSSRCEIHWCSTFNIQVMSLVKIHPLLTKLLWYMIPSDTELYSTSAVSVLWWCIERCWEDSVYIQALCHRFWKLTLQVRRCSVGIRKLIVCGGSH